MTMKKPHSQTINTEKIQRHNETDISGIEYGKANKAVTDQHLVHREIRKSRDK